MNWLKNDIVTSWSLNPMTLMLLGAAVKDEVDVKVIDAQFGGMSIDDLKREISEYKPDYVGISILTSEYKQLLEMSAEAVKSVDKDIVTIAGGVHATTMHEDVMTDPNIDYCVIGEGEEVLRELMLYLGGRGELPSRGLAYRDGEQTVYQERALIDDLTKLPWPDYDLIDFEPYTTSSQRSFNPLKAPEVPYVRMVNTRGCPFGCSFCQVDIISGRDVRARAPEDVVEEMLYLKKRYGIKSVIFDEDNLLMARSFAKRLFELMIEREVGLKWIATAFALFLINDEMLDLMKRSGCVGINVAIESGNKRVLKEIVHKPIRDLDLVPEIIAKIKAKDIFCYANFIIGFPGETWEEIRETVRFAENCGADYVKIYAAVPLYNTELYHIARKMELIETDSKFPKVDWRYAQIKSDEWTTKDISILRAYEWDRINFKPEKVGKLMEFCGISKEELDQVRKSTRDSLIFSAEEQS